MNTKVVYHSTTGNTRKVAEAIARAVGCSAEPVDSADLSGSIDLLFIGGAIYATHDHKLHPSMSALIDKLNPDRIKRTVPFITYAFNNDALDQLRRLLKLKRLVVTDDCFKCKGKFLLFNRKHPDADDLRQAAEFAKRIVNG